MAASYDEQIKAYVHNVCVKYITAENDLSDRSITLLYSDACNNGDFVMFNSIADWSLWTAIFQNERFLIHRCLYEAIGSRSYLVCNGFMKGQWPIFERLARNFSEIASETHQKFVFNH